MSQLPGHQDLREVKVEKKRQRRNTHTAVSLPYEGGKKGIPKVSSKSSDFVYVNQAYVGSLNSVHQPSREPRGPRVLEPPITEVYREQYWSCSKWSFTKRVLSISAGLVLGLGIGLAVTMAIRGEKPEDLIGGIFRSSAAPD